MARPYSLDLRRRVAATIVRWIAALEATGTLAAQPRVRPRRSKLDPHGACLRDLIAAKTAA
jgi:transposase